MALMREAVRRGTAAVLARMGQRRLDDREQAARTWLRLVDAVAGGGELTETDGEEMIVAADRLEIREPIAAFEDDVRRVRQIRAEQATLDAMVPRRPGEVVAEEIKTLEARLAALRNERQAIANLGMRRSDHLRQINELKSAVPARVQPLIKKG